MISSVEGGALPLRSNSPPPDAFPVPAINACLELSRCLSTTSSLSLSSGGDVAFRKSLGSDIVSRHSSGSFDSRMSDIFQASSRHSAYSVDGLRSRRRGYVRPQGTDFAASARSRESVMSLGSIAHLQYYFARTGLLDGKGAQLATKKQYHGQATSPDGLIPPRIIAVDYDSPYADALVESPVDDDYCSNDFDDTDPTILPPTVSTYNHRQKTVPRPPTVDELKEHLTISLEDLVKSLSEARGKINVNISLIQGTQIELHPMENDPGWYEAQGMHMLDVATLAIRAAKIYYTAHEQPGRLTAIKSEKELRAELLSVMEVLKQMATRAFIGGMRLDEISRIEAWINSVYFLLLKDEEAEVIERAERKNWLWAKPSWPGTIIERELAFVAAMDPKSDPPPPFSPAQDAAELPTSFLNRFQTGLRLVKLHNSAVRKSRRRFGAIPVFHTDTMKPYRCADNLRYWVKAAELRWEVVLKIDPLGIVYNSGPDAWRDFEVAILKWCRKVREEISSELQ